MQQAEEELEEDYNPWAQDDERCQKTKKQAASGGSYVRPSEDPPKVWMEKAAHQQ